jgi:hypothetical protein
VRGGSKAYPQAKSRRGNGAREDDVAGRLTSGRRCSRRRLDEEGGTSSVFTAASCFLLWLGSPVGADGSSRPQAFPRSGAPAATRRPTCFSWPPLLCHPCGGVHTRKVITPTRVGGMRQRPQGFPIGSRSRRCEGRKGRERSYWCPWHDVRRGSTPVVAESPLASPGKGKGVIPP